MTDGAAFPLGIEDRAVAITRVGRDSAAPGGKEPGLVADREECRAGSGAPVGAPAWFINEGASGSITPATAAAATTVAATAAATAAATVAAAATAAATTVAAAAATTPRLARLGFVDRQCRPS